MSVQAMFYVKEINHRATNQADSVNVEVKLAAAFGGYLQGLPEGNGDWSKWTPSGELSMTITNPAAIEQFEIGAVYSLNLLSFQTPWLLKLPAKSISNSSIPSAFRFSKASLDEFGHRPPCSARITKSKKRDFRFRNRRLSFTCLPCCLVDFQSPIALGILESSIRPQIASNANPVTQSTGAAWVTAPPNASLSITPKSTAN